MISYSKARRARALAVKRQREAQAVIDACDEFMHAQDFEDRRRCHERLVQLALFGGSHGA